MKRILLISSFLILSTCHLVLGQDNENFEELSSFYHYWYSSYCIEIEDDIAYVGTKYGLRILNIGDLEFIVPIAGILYDYQINDIRLVGDFLYVAAEENHRNPGSPGLYILNIEDPANPVEVGYLESANPDDIFISGELAYMTSQSGIWIVDISDTQNPGEASFHNIPCYPHEMEIINSIAYVADSDSGLRIYDISDIENIVETGHFQTDFQASSVEVVDTIVYLSDFGPYDSRALQIPNGHFRIIDVSDPSEPEEIAIIRDNGNYYVKVHDDIAFLGNGYYNDVAYDVSDPENPQFICNLRDGIINLEFFDDWVISCDYSLKFLDFDDLENIGVLAQFSVGIPSDIAVYGDFGFMSNGSKIYIYDITNDEFPVRMDCIDRSSSRFELSGDFCISSSGGRIDIFDISDPLNAELTGSIDVPSCRKIEVTEERIYAATEYWRDGIGLKIIDWSNPSNPRLLGSFDSPQALDVGVYGDYAFLGSLNYGLAILDISDPENIQEVNRINYDHSPTCVEIIDNYAIIDAGANNGSLKILDISDPVNPVETGEFLPGRHPRVDDLCIEGDIAYILAYHDIYAIDISDRRNPRPVGFLETPSGTRFMRSFNGYFYCNFDGAVHKYVLSDGSFLSVNPSSLDFNFITTGHSTERNLLLRNNGNEALTVRSIQSELGQFSFQFDAPFNLDPDEEFETPVSFLSPDDGVFIDTVTIRMDHEGGFDRKILLKAKAIQGVYLQCPNYTDNVLLSNGYLYVTCRDSGILVVDISDPITPEIVHIVNLDFRVSKFSSSNDLLFAIGHSRANDRNYYHLVCFDISNPIAPELLSEIDDLDNSFNIEAYGENVFLTKLRNPIKVYNYRQPRNPTLIYTSALSYDIRISRIENDMLYASDRQYGVFTFDISNPRSIQPRDSVEFRWIREFDIVNSHLHCFSENQYRVFNVEDIDNIQEVHSMESWGRGRYSYVTHFDNKLYVSIGDRTWEVDISDPSEPIVGDSLYSSYPEGIAVEEDVLFVATGSNGVIILDLTGTWDVEENSPAIVPSKFILHPAYPNPFNSTTTIKYNLPYQSNVSLQVYNLSGQQISTLFEGNRPAGFHSVNLNANDLPSGLYFVKLDAGGQTFTRKVMLLK